MRESKEREGGKKGEEKEKSDGRVNAGGVEREEENREGKNRRRGERGNHITRHEAE